MSYSFRGIFEIAERNQKPVHLIDGMDKRGIIIQPVVSETVRSTLIADQFTTIALGLHLLPEQFGCHVGDDIIGSAVKDKGRPHISRDVMIGRYRFRRRA